MTTKELIVQKNNKIIKIINLTSHNINIIDAEPASIKNIDNVKYETIEKYKEFNVKWEDKEIEWNGFKLIKRNPVISNKEINEIVNEIKNDFGNDEIIAIVSLPTLNAIKAIYPNAKIDNIQFVSIISATMRGIYPPIACKYHFSI